MLHHLSYLMVIERSTEFRMVVLLFLLFVTLERIDEKVNISRHLCLLLRYASRFIESKIQES